MPQSGLASLATEIGNLTAIHDAGRVICVDGGCVHVGGLGTLARVGDRLRLVRRHAPPIEGEVIQIAPESLTMLPDTSLDGIAVDDRVLLLGTSGIFPCDDWIGRVIDPMGQPLDGRPLPTGPQERSLQNPPPLATSRRGLGARLETGLRAFNTLLPIVRGQRLGIFAGSGVGKTRLLSQFAKNLQSDVVVVALIGERGREVGEFVSDVLGEKGMKRCIIVAATSDQSPIMRRRCAWTAMTVAEHFRDGGAHVLLLADSVTRFAEAHREIVAARGEAPVLRGFPASTAHTVMSLAERAGPGPWDGGDITAIFTVLVAGSDMDEPIADILRGVMDGHIILDRRIAERGRFPAIDLPRSVSRSLPNAASDAENQTISMARQLMGTYDENQTMIRAGLYVAGSDPILDQAVNIWPELDAFLSEEEPGKIAESFSRLRLILRRGTSARQNDAPS